jgi:hypothetical protein
MRRTNQTLPLVSFLREARRSCTRSAIRMAASGRTSAGPGDLAHTLYCTSLRDPSRRLALLSHRIPNIAYREGILDLKAPVQDAEIAKARSNSLKRRCARVIRWRRRKTRPIWVPGRAERSSLRQHLRKSGEGEAAGRRNYREACPMEAVEAMTNQDGP